MALLNCINTAITWLLQRQFSRIISNPPYQKGFLKDYPCMLFLPEHYFKKDWGMVNPITVNPLLYFSRLQVKIFCSSKKKANDLKYRPVNRYRLRYQTTKHEFILFKANSPSNNEKSWRVSSPKCVFSLSTSGIEPQSKLGLPIFWYIHLWDSCQSTMDALMDMNGI